MKYKIRRYDHTCGHATDNLDGICEGCKWFAYVMNQRPLYPPPRDNILHKAQEAQLNEDHH